MLGVGTCNTAQASEPTLLFNDLTLQSESSATLVAPAPIEVAPHVFVSFATPIHFSVTRSALIRSPTSTTKAFADGWDRLPNELQVHILGYFVSYRKTIYNVPTSHDWVGYLVQCSKRSPEIYVLAKQIFYGNNTFLLDVRSGFFRYPSHYVTCISAEFSSGLRDARSSGRSCRSSRLEYTASTTSGTCRYK